MCIRDSFGGGGLIGKRFNLYKADISVDGKKIKSVGIRTKGFIGSLNPERPSLKIKFNEYVDQSPVQGLDRLTLNNNVQDVSLASQYLTYKLFNKAGVPAPRVSHCKVTVNGEYLGVYSHVESVRSPFIKKHFQRNSGELYEGTISDFYPIAVQNIEAKNSYTEKNRTQALKLAEILETKEDFELDEAKKYINLKQFVRFWAMESLLGFWDGYTNNQNNYYAYSNPNDQKRFHFIPWGADGAFTKGRGPFGKFGGDENHPNSVYSQSMLANRLFQSDEVKALYKATMVDILKNVWDENEIIADIKRIQAFTMDHLHSRQNRLDEGAGKLITFVENRRSDIEPELDDWPISIQGGPRIPRHSVRVGELSGSFKTKWINERMRDVSGEGEAVLKLNLNGENIAISDLGSIGQPEELRRWFGRRGSEQSRVLNPTITLQGVSKDDGKELTVVITVDLKDFKSNDKDVSFRGSLNLRDIDDDQDGFSSTVDCDDNNPNVNPDEDEIWNGIDDNCDGIIDEFQASVGNASFDMGWNTVGWNIDYSDAEYKGHNLYWLSANHFAYRFLSSQDQVFDWGSACSVDNFANSINIDDLLSYQAQ